MKNYLMIVSVIMIIVLPFTFFGLILIPYPVLNLIFLFQKDPPSWIQPTLQYMSLSLAILAGIAAVLCVIFTTPDLYLTLFLIPLLLIAIHGIIEFRYVRDLASTDGRRSNI